MKNSALNARLLCAAELTRQDATFADIGTDHAYLPLFLLESGKIKFAYCCDINEGPLASARKNAEERLRLSETEFILTDGATVLAGKGITDYAIAGMGGELIADIIDSAPQLRSEKVNLALQPMTKPEILRAYLYDNGFDIINEKYVADEGKKYVCMRACYVGSPVPYTPADIHFGKECFADKENSGWCDYMSEQYSRLQSVIRGKKLGALSTELEDELIKALSKRLGIS